MKEKLLERLKIMENAVAQQNQKLNQAMADMNVLTGQHQELINVISLLDLQEENKVKDDEVKCDENQKCADKELEELTE